VLPKLRPAKHIDDDRTKPYGQVDPNNVGHVGLMQKGPNVVVIFYAVLDRKQRPTPDHVY
jgi:hypothetical protein